jgi:single-strand DNA-binding protein
MSRSVNRVILVGNAGSDPDVRETANGKTVAHVSLATSERWSTATGEEKTRTAWHRLTFWNGAADVIGKHVRKGSRLFIEGRIEYGSYDRGDGNMVPTCEIIVSEFVFLDSKKDGEV